MNLLLHANTGNLGIQEQHKGVFVTFSHCFKFEESQQLGQHTTTKIHVFFKIYTIRKHVANLMWVIKTFL